jgi:hypothetical protein
MTQATTNAGGKFDLTERIIAYETGDISHEGFIELFQYLVDTGLAWKLQGSYGRLAEVLIADNVIKAPKKEDA